ncbi:putative membrane protein [Wickerhamomyces ciferrii]|uniref:Membrane protein n=1 Tax=Wickerhamomyces ciferrii (strain ATCC 14091 / BCRC 22168 / CBS 111 / JCM 3599 / NBRC 0793 / NRRL Y-1031 F-60-10) TaxID=1206466 RepID=K0KV54_WICCF|nr:uncharacterized protein BN7_5348 [Wickerhamomyces ciferrii]CCH45762.1 putative membrane protein [Wickerhamomyces ciferrii]
MKDLNIEKILPNEKFRDASFQETGLSEVYTIGTDSYCRSDQQVVKSCVKGFFPDIKLMFLKEIKQFGSPSTKQVSYIDLSLPDDLPKFDENPSANDRKAILYCLLVALILNGITILTAVIDLIVSRLTWLSLAGEVLILVSSILYLASAASSISLFSTTRTALNNSSLGIKATFGNTAFHCLVWFAFAISLSTFTLVLIKNYLTKSSMSTLWRLIKDGPIPKSDPERNSNPSKYQREKPPSPKTAKAIDMDKRMDELYEKLAKYQMEQEKWEKFSYHHNEEVTDDSKGTRSDASKSTASESFSKTPAQAVEGLEKSDN